jgi:flavorubredoxin
MTIPATGPGPRQIVPDRLYALGDAFPIDGRVTWVPRGSSGFQATTAYLLREGRRTLIIDPGPAYQGDLLVEQVRSLIPPGTGVEVFLSRSEPDAFGSLAHLAAAFNVDRVYAAGGHNPFDAFEYVGAALERERAKAVFLARLGADAALDLGPSRRLTVLSPAVRVNSTVWLYDEVAAALFTSDPFSHLLGRTRAEAVEPAREPLPELTASTVAEHMLAKMWWIGLADTRPIQANLREIFEDRPVDVIAPCHGRPIVGRSAVEQAYRLLLESLARVSVEEAAAAP